ncbi:plasmid transfer protein TraA [Streptomyces sp. Ac-502]|uniref:plasmid transfer protein TraA n=1 Tax=Streptomyces sp. Ac-502 TaxID=3342801 RepID=UPI0038629A4A
MAVNGNRVSRLPQPPDNFLPPGVWAEQPRLKQSSPRQRAEAREAKRNRTTYKTKSRTKEYHVHINAQRSAAAAAAAGGGQWGRQQGIGDIEVLSASGLRALCERGRRVLREASNDIAFAEETLRKALRQVPPPSGEGRSAAWVRANKVARHLKRAKNAAQAGSAHMAATWVTYTREYEPELNRFGGPRAQRRQAMDFGA